MRTLALSRAPVSLPSGERKPIVRVAIVITIFLIHPTQSQPIRRWTFVDESVVRVGRAKDSHVVVHGSLVSRHHLELWNRQDRWELINFGANGTYIDGHPIHQLPVADGMTVRLGSTGPRLQLRLSDRPVEDWHDRDRQAETDELPSPPVTVSE